MHIGPGHPWALCEAALQMSHDALDYSYQQLVEAVVGAAPFQSVVDAAVQAAAHARRWRPVARRADGRAGEPRPLLCPALEATCARLHVTTCLSMPPEQVQSRATDAMAPLTSALSACNQPCGTQLSPCSMPNGGRSQSAARPGHLPLAARTQLRGMHEWSVPQHMWPLCRRNGMHVLTWRHAQAAARKAALAAEAACAALCPSYTSTSLNTSGRGAARAARARSSIARGGAAL